MTPQDFLAIADLMHEPAVLVAREGRVLAANRVAARIMSVDHGAVADACLTRLVADPPEKVLGLLNTCSRSRAWLPMSFRRPDGRALRCQGALVSPPTTTSDALIMLKWATEVDRSVSEFRALNEKISELNLEIGRRLTSERALAEQMELATFGREIGLAISQATTREEMLQSCTTLMVKHLNAAFARVWTLDQQGQVLVLEASAGQYTHLDGEHSRIPLGKYKIGMIAAKQQPHLTNSVLGDTRVHDQQWAQREGMVAFAGYPLIVDGRTIGVMAMFSRQALSEGALQAMGGIANGIALGIERKRIETELRQQTEALETANRRKDEFLAMLAHELRNPLSPIRSGLDLLTLEHGEGDTINLIKDQVIHMSRLVDDLLDVSRIMRGKIELRKECVDLNEIVRRAAKTVEPLIADLEHHLALTLADQPIRVMGDTTRLLQIVTNLLTNAAKYTPHAGDISVMTRQAGEWAEMCVRDNGIGVDAEFLPQMFELFSQADTSLDRSHGGLGIGLTLAQRLVKLHGGNIVVHSDGLGKGCEFSVQIPKLMAAIEANVETPQPRHAELPATALRILVVDDSVGSAKIVQRLLRAIGQDDVELAHDGEAALAAVLATRPDVVFLDIGLPKKDGYAVAQAIRQNDHVRGTLLVALTGYGSELDRKRSADAGFDIHLVKPVGIDALRHVLAEGLPSCTAPSRHGCL